MKVLRGIIGVIVMFIMVGLGLIGVVLTISSVQIQPENLTNLTTDIVVDTLSKDNLKKIQVSDVETFLPAEIKAELPANATIEDVVPIMFDNLTGLESYISVDTVNQMIEDDVVKDFAIAVINEEKYDLVQLADKYEIPLGVEEKEMLSELDTSTFRDEMKKQGFDIDKLTLEGMEALSESEKKIFAILNPGFTIVILIVMLAVFYLLFGLIWWDLKTGLIWWGIGLGLIGIVLLVLNGIKFEVVKFGLGLTNMRLNTALITPAIERLARPVIISGIVFLLSGVGAVIGGELYKKSKVEQSPKSRNS